VPFKPDNVLRRLWRGKKGTGDVEENYSRENVLVMLPVTFPSCLSVQFSVS
jgi:hypothetical protein